MARGEAHARRERPRVLIATVLSAWLQYAADGTPHARAVVTGTCPVASFDGRSEPMSRRAAEAPGFSDVVCDAAVPVGAKHVRAGERDLPPPAHDPKRIVVLGDTGCRISGVSVQACDDPAAWPFPALARQIAALHPDLVIHVGDYLYRENACPIALAGCAGSPHGDDAAAWYADFLTPAAPLFAAAPLVLVRGNHEECKRNGIGWFRYLDPHATTACTDQSSPYAADLGDLRLAVFDSAIAEDTGVNASHGAVYRTQFAQVRALASGAHEAWFLTHRPPYLNADERAALGDTLAPPFSAALSGHLHFFAALNAEHEPPLLVNGEGGTKLDADYGPFLAFAAGDIRVTGSVFSVDRNGYGVYDRRGDGWTVTMHDAAGAERARCILAAREVRCTR